MPSTISASPAGDLAQVAVADTGIGIPAEDRGFGAHHHRPVLDAALGRLGVLL